MGSVEEINQKNFCDVGNFGDLKCELKLGISPVALKAERIKLDQPLKAPLDNL